jgi:glycosyltransferase involved in cell wall biosynthesis
LKGLFGEENVIPWVGGCEGEQMRHTYGTAQYKHPSDGALILSAHRGTDWWKNPNTAVLVAYGIYKRYPETVYFKPSPRGETKDKPKDPEKALLNNIAFDIQYGGTPKEGVSREELLKTMACAQLAIEPFFSEGYSRSCNEMGNLGVPVIQGSNASWYLGENDLLRKHLLLTDSSDIQEIIDKALALLEDGGLWNEVSQECVKFFSRFNVEQEVYTLLNALGD